MIYNIIRFVIQYRQALMIAGAVLAVLGAYQWAKATGRAECKAAQEKAIQDAQNAAQKEIRKVQDAYRQKKADIPAQDSGDGVGRLVRHAFSQLPDGGGR